MGKMSTKPLDSSSLRRLPKVDRVLRQPAIAELLEKLPRWAVVEAIRLEIARLRSSLSADVQTTPEGLDGDSATDPVEVDSARIAAAARDLVRPSLRRVLNATGVVLHTNLGRAPLPALALQRISDLAGGYLNLEYRLDEGSRGSRQEHAQALLTRLTGAEAHLIVNNNAAAVLLMLAGLCAGREVIVSRGELVEIGGSFRIPDVMRASLAILREVGTTNRTHLRDFQAAIAAGTRALLKVHRSNFAVVGFTAEVTAEELSRCAHAAGLLCLYDVGSGALSALPGHASATDEPTVKSALAAGCDVVTFSCDKLLGGPQAGVICGTRAAIEPLRQHPLLRALRPDKLSLLALSATLELYRDGRENEVPTWAMLNASPASLLARAERLRALCIAAQLAVELLPTRSAVGGGAMPLEQPESYALSLRCDAAGSRRLEAALRRGDPPVIARLVEDRLLCDVRTLSDDELPALAKALAAAWKECCGG